jgi:hypothetical protein
MAHDEAEAPSEGGLGEGRTGGSATFIDVESGGWPVYAPSPIKRTPNPGGTTPRCRL